MQTLTTSSSAPRRAVTAANVAAVVVFAICAVKSVAVHVDAAVHDDEPAAADVAAVVAAHASVVEAGDRVLIHPPWRDDVVDAIIEGGVDRRALPRGVVVSEAFTRLSDGPWPALVVVTAGDAPLPRSIADRLAAQAPPVITSGEVRLFRLAGDAATDELDIAKASVSVELKGKRVRCPYNAQRARHVCPGLPQWMTVGDETLQIGGRGEGCVWAHPISGGRVVIDYGVVDTGAGLDFAAALSDAAAANATGAAVDVALNIDGKDVAELRVHRQPGFVRRVVAASGVARVKVTVSTDNDGQRHTCFRLAPRRKP